MIPPLAVGDSAALSRFRVAVSAIFARPRPAATRAIAVALELSGTADPTSPAIDAAFDTVLDGSTGPAIPATASPAPGLRAPVAVVRGYAADGRVLFALPLYESGPFHAYVGLEAPGLAALSRLDLVTANARAVRDAGALARAELEVVTVDDDHVLVKWNGRDVPAVRVRERVGGPIVAIGSDPSGFAQLSFASSAPQLLIELSDGVHSVEEVVRVFGR